MARITLDVIMATGFDLHWDAVDLEKPCPLLEDMHFLMAETFRYHTEQSPPKPNTIEITREADRHCHLDLESMI